MKVYAEDYSCIITGIKNQKLGKGKKSPRQIELVIKNKSKNN